MSGTVTTRRAGAFALAPFALLFAATSLSPSERIEASYEVEKAPIVVPVPSDAVVAPAPEPLDEAELTDQVADDGGPGEDVAVAEPAPEAAPIVPDATAPAAIEPVADEPAAVETTTAVEVGAAPAVGAGTPTAAPATQPAAPEPPVAGAVEAERIHAGPRMIDAPTTQLD